MGQRNEADVLGVFYNGISIRNQKKANMDSLLLNRWFEGLEAQRRPEPPEGGINRPDLSPGSVNKPNLPGGKAPPGR